ncbi:DEAD-box ATP-dependent RNA helicase 47B [Porphyridium purpureum]|uniref:RNA helicase n=1 Tax=Porphyridium purpureum TaxID=35688 RepID=A0A5J4YMB5_PORPP|nr:DEAD-box ATP-dependent RNA helicase 47B [Porphyridium purpureum]|eukprot:POR8501..scf244_11
MAEVDTADFPESPKESGSSPDEGIAILSAVAERNKVQQEQAGVLTDIASIPPVLNLGDVTARARSRDDIWSEIVDVCIPDGRTMFAQEPAGSSAEASPSTFLSSVPFEALLLTPELIRNLKIDMNHHYASLIQSIVIPRILDGHSMVFQSHTGSGKTLAFSLPILEDLIAALEAEEKPGSSVAGVQAVIVAPTRELAVQISEDLRKLTDDTDIRVMALIGGANYARQAEKVKKNKPHIIVGTPGRLNEVSTGGARKSLLPLGNVKFVVVDEIDHCLQDETSAEDLEAVLKRCPKSRQTIFSSATADSQIVKQFAAKWMTSGGERNYSGPLLVRLRSETNRLPPNVTHAFTVIPKRLHIDTLRRILFTAPIPKSAMCFVNDAKRLEIVYERCLEFNIAAVPLRGTADKVERANVLRAFKKGDFTLLIATEVAARGLDCPDVEMVVSLDLPTDADHYLHRAGRCGRAGKPGRVISVADGKTQFVLGKFAKSLGIEITSVSIQQGKIVPFDKVEHDKTVYDSDQDESSKGANNQRKKQTRASIVKNKGKPDLLSKKEGKRKDDQRSDVPSGLQVPLRQNSVFKNKWSSGSQGGGETEDAIADDAVPPLVPDYKPKDESPAALKEVLLKRMADAKARGEFDEDDDVYSVGQKNDGRVTAESDAESLFGDSTRPSSSSSFGSEEEYERLFSTRAHGRPRGASSAISRPAPSTPKSARPSSASRPGESGSSEAGSRRTPARDSPESRTAFPKSRKGSNSIDKKRAVRREVRNRSPVQGWVGNRDTKSKTGEE